MNFYLLNEICKQFILYIYAISNAGNLQGNTSEMLIIHILRVRH